MIPMRHVLIAVLARSIRCGWIGIFGLAGLSGQTDPPLHQSRLTLAPSDRQLQTLRRFEPQWVIPAQVAAQLPEFLRSSGFDPSLAATLVAGLRPGPDESSRQIRPDAALLARFSLRERELWHLVLQVHHSNFTYRWPLSLSPETLAALEREPRWTDAVARLRTFGQSHYGRLVFRDLFVLEETFASAPDRAEFFRHALAGEAPVLKLRRRPDRPLDAAAQAAWWQVNGRYRAIEPLLSAVAAIPDAPRLDVAHLLPRLPRALLNSYPPSLSVDDNPGVDSALFASGFFDLNPGVDPGAPGGLTAWLASQCVAVHGPPQYGDICVFGNLDQSAWPYSGVYIADGMVLARRPTLFGAWQFLGVDEIGRLNPRYAGLPPKIFRPRAAGDGPAAAPFLPSRMPDAWRKQLQLRPVPPGPWGRLWYYEVLLAPSGNTLERLPAPDASPVWTFAGVTPADIEAAIRAVPMPDAVRRDLLALFAGVVPDREGRITVRPSLDLVLAVPRDFRTRLFPHLVGGDSVTDYAQHIPFPAGFTLEEWFDAGSLPESVRQAILRLAYPSGDRVMLSDFGALYSLLPSRAEQLAAHRAALRVPALVLLMEKPRPEEVPSLAAYWNIGRAKSIERFLAAFAAAPEDLRYLDIIHLLSPIEREFLNTYFTPEGPSLTPSCFWSAFSFGQERPDDRYLVLPGQWTDHEELAGRDLRERFDPVPAPDRLGDIVAYRRRGSEDVMHVCVFIADGIVFTKNGYTFSRPWHLTQIKDVDELYLTAPDVEKVYFRRRLTP